MTRKRTDINNNYSFYEAAHGCDLPKNIHLLQSLYFTPTDEYDVTVNSYYINQSSIIAL